MNKWLIAVLLVVSACFCFGQKRSKQVEFAPLHLGLTNGIGTNGIYDLKYENNVSLNLLSGQSFGNNILCISGISHFQVMKSQGIYLSGVSTVTGGYPFLKKNDLDDSLATFNAIQISGLINAVNGTGDGAQISGLTNLVAGSLDGFQLSPIYNGTRKGFSGAQLSVGVNKIGEYGVGAQLGVLINTAKNFSGSQLGLFNMVSNDLDGFQMGAFNYIGNKKSSVYRNFHFFWLQLGLINRAYQNSDGMQIGIINWSKDVGFSQFGVINISQKIPQFSIGFLNIAEDAQSFLKISSNRSFIYNIELATGSKKILNIASYRFDPRKDIRAIGYAIGNQRKGGYRKGEYFFDYYLTMKQIKEKNQPFHDPNLTFGIEIGAGYNPFLLTRLPWMFFFVNISANIHKIRNGNRLVDGILSGEKGSYEHWVDVSFGIQF